MAIWVVQAIRKVLAKLMTNAAYIAHIG